MITLNQYDMNPKVKKKIVVFLSSETLEALNKRAEIEENSRSSVASAIIKKGVEKFKQ